jgi:uncharacterized protein YdiU (UPF0061 family)
MAHAVIMQVKLPDGGNSEEGRRMLEEMVVPNAKAQTGFQSGTWMNSAGDGTGVVVFDTEDNARAAQEALKPPPDGPALVSSVIAEVGAQA